MAGARCEATGPIAIRVPSRAGRLSAAAGTSCVLRHAVAERPVLPCGFQQVDEDVLRAQPRVGGELLREALIERLLLRHRVAAVAGDLHDHQIIAALDAEVAWVAVELRGIMLMD